MDKDFALKPVPPEARDRTGRFWSLYAGEHAAGTEFMIGPLFIAAGVGARDLILGLLIGNLLAVLMWRYLTMPVAAATSQATLAVGSLSRMVSRTASEI